MFFFNFLFSITVLAAVRRNKLSFCANNGTRHMPNRKQWCAQFEFELFRSYITHPFIISKVLINAMPIIIRHPWVCFWGNNIQTTFILHLSTLVGFNNLWSCEVSTNISYLRKGLKKWQLQELAARPMPRTNITVRLSVCHKSVFY